MNSALALFLAILISYALGSFPTAYLIGRLNGINIFAIGSGNMGATNVSRALGTRWALLVFAIDVGKGALAVAIARLLPGDLDPNTVAAGVAVVIGHNWSLVVTLITGKLRGGKGAATSGGTWLVVFGAWWYMIAIPLGAVIAVMLITRYVSLAVLVGTMTALVGALLLMASGQGVSALYLIYVLILFTMIFYRHRENIQRLIEGRERKLGEPARK